MLFLLFTLVAPLQLLDDGSSFITAKLNKVSVSHTKTFIVLVYVREQVAQEELNELKC